MNDKKRDDRALNLESLLCTFSFKKYFAITGKDKWASSSGVLFKIRGNPEGTAFKIIL